MFKLQKGKAIAVSLALATTMATTNIAKASGVTDPLADIDFSGVAGIGSILPTQTLNLNDFYYAVMGNNEGNKESFLVAKTYDDGTYKQFTKRTDGNNFEIPLDARMDTYGVVQYTAHNGMALQRLVPLSFLTDDTIKYVSGTLLADIENAWNLDKQLNLNTENDAKNYHPIQVHMVSLVNTKTDKYEQHICINPILDFRDMVPGKTVIWNDLNGNGLLSVTDGLIIPCNPDYVLNPVSPPLTILSVYLWNEFSAFDAAYTNDITKSFRP